MIYATEYRGLKTGRVAFTWEPKRGSSWAGFDLDQHRLHLKLARRLRGRRDVQCSSSLRPFCTRRGWVVTPPPEEVRRLAAGFFLAEELDLPLKLAVSNEAAALVTASEQFLAARPWRALARRAFEVRVDGTPAALASVLPDTGRGPGVLMLFRPTGPRRTVQLIDHLVFLLGRQRGALAARFEALHAPRMHPWFQLVRGGELFSPLGPAEVRLITGVLEGTAALASGKRARGKGVVLSAVGARR